MPQAIEKSAKATAKHETAAVVAKAAALAVPSLISKALMGRLMQDPELGTQFGFGCGIALSTLGISFSAANNIIDALEPHIAEFRYKDLISLMLHASNVLLSSSCALGGFAGAVAFMNADMNQSAMDAGYLFPLLIFIAAIRALTQKSANSHVKKLGEAAVEIGISIAAGVSAGQTSGELHAFLSATTALFTAIATSSVTGYLGSFFMASAPKKPKPELGLPLLTKASEASLEQIPA
jgi:hypothetical protein